VFGFHAGKVGAIDRVQTSQSIERAKFCFAALGGRTGRKSPLAYDIFVAVTGVAQSLKQ
jgi:hypothetical protein